MQNQTFGEMLKAALIPLAGRAPGDIALQTGMVYDAVSGCFSLESLGRKIAFRWPECALPEGIEPWHFLVILHYMDQAAGIQPSGRLIPFGAQTGGMVRGGGFDRDCENAVRRQLGACEPALLEEACCSMGGRLLSSNADLCAEFAFLPRYPLTLKIWFADDEMEASGRMFLDEAARHSLSVEDSVTAGTLILEGLLKSISREETP